MAEAPKRGGGSRLYGKSPRIDREPADGDVVTSAGGAPDGAAAAAGAAPSSQANMNTDEGPEGDVMAGTEGIPTHHHQHAAERSELHHRHMHEHHAMHERHEREHLMRAMGHHHEKQPAMHERHHEERRKMHTQHERELREMHDRHEETAGPTGGIREKDVGKKGTEP